MKALEEKTQAKRRKREMEESKLAEVIRRRNLIEDLTEQKLQKMLKDKEEQLAKHSSRIHERTELSQERTRESQLVADQKQKKVQDNLSKIVELQKLRMEENMRHKNMLFSHAEEVRASVTNQKTRKLHEEAQQKRAISEFNRHQLHSFEQNKIRNAQNDIAVKNSIWVDRSNSEARMRNQLIEERRKRAEAARHRHEQYEHLKYVQDLEHLQTVEDRLKTVLQMRQEESMARKVAHEQKALNVKAMALRVEQQQEALSKKYLDHFEEAKLIGELTRKSQQIRL